MAHPFLQEIFNDPMAYVIHAECSKLSDMAEKAAQCLHLYMYVYPYSSVLTARPNSYFLAYAINENR